MNIFNRLAKAFRLKSVGSLIDGTTFRGFEHSGDIASLSAYKQSLYLYIATSKVAKRAAGVPLELYRIKSTKGEVEELFDHPLIDLLSKPNPLQTQRQFFELSVVYYLLSGDCFWYLTREGGRIVEAIPLRPDRVTIKLNTEGNDIVGYEYQSGKVYKFAPEDIIHISNIDPENPLRGIGVTRPATSRISAEIEATQYQSNFFKNQGRPEFVVFADQVVTEEQSDDFRTRWKRLFGGENAGNVGVFGSQVRDIHEVNKTPKEMDFIESQKFLRDDILAALHVPKAMVTSDDVNLANAKEAYRMFLQEGVVPVLDAFVDAMNNRLCPMVDEAVFFTFSDPVPVDRDMLLKEATELKRAGIISANEARELFNYEPVDGADTLAMASTSLAELAKRAKMVIRTRPRLVTRLRASEAFVEAITTTPKRQMNSVFPTKSMKTAYAKAYNDRADRKSEKLFDAIKKYSDGLEARILATDLAPATFMDAQEEKRIARDTLTPLVVQLYKDGGQAALDALYQKSETNFFADELMLASLNDRIFFFTDSMTETTFEILKGKIVSGVAAGDGVDVIAESIRDHFSDWGVKRARMVARTETGFVLSKATNDAYMQSNVVTGKEWISVGDENVRDEHVANDGQIVAKGAAFPSGEHYPGEHSINCRCVLAPAV